MKQYESAKLSIDQVQFRDLCFPTGNSFSYKYLILTIGPKHFSAGYFHTWESIYYMAPFTPTFCIQEKYEHGPGGSLFKNSKWYPPPRWYCCRRNIAGEDQNLFLLLDQRASDSACMKPSDCVKKNDLPHRIEVAHSFLQFLDLIGWFVCSQLQRLIHLLFENLSSLLDSVLAINQTGKLQESPAQTLDDLIPTLRKLRKLAGILIVGSAYSRMKWFSTLLFFSFCWSLSIDLLDMPLKSITAAWETDELVNHGFKQSEVCIKINQTSILS